MDYEKILERIRRIEALYARTDVAGEKAAAGHALDAILAQLRKSAEQDPPIEFRFSLQDAWSRRLFLALARRYGLQPYRHSGQRRTTVMLKISKSFVEQTLWPEFTELSALLRTHLDQVTDEIIAQSLHASSEDETAVTDQNAGALPAPGQ